MKCVSERIINDNYKICLPVRQLGTVVISCARWMSCMVWDSYHDIDRQEVITESILRYTSLYYEPGFILTDLLVFIFPVC
jgi:hypothetical protein